MTEQPTATIGDNNPPPYDAAELEEFEKTLREFAHAGDEWNKFEKLENAEQAGKLNDFVSGLKSFKSKVDKARKAAKDPWLTKGREVDAAFNSRIAAIDVILKAVNPLSTDWLKREQERLNAERRAAEEQARQEAARAEEMKRQAEARGDLLGVADAEEAKKDAEAAQKAAAKPQKARASSATGAGRAQSLRQTKVVYVENVRLLFLHFQDHPDVKDVLGRIAAQTVRQAGYDETKNPIPGIRIEIKETAV